MSDAQARSGARTVPTESSRATSESAREALASWAAGLGRWQAFATVTFAPVVGRGSYDRRGWGFGVAYGQDLFGRYCDAYLGVLELHDSGAPHLHALLQFKAGLEGTQACSDVERDARLEVGKVQRVRMKYEGKGGAEAYLTKYVMKEPWVWFYQLHGYGRGISTLRPGLVSRSGMPGPWVRGRGWRCKRCRRTDDEHSSSCGRS